MHLQHFGLTHAPLGKKSKTLWDDGQFSELQKRFQWLLDSPGIGVLTAAPGLGKTSMLRHITEKLNPHQYQIIYVAETDFSRIEFYRHLATAFGLQPRYRRTQQWKELKDKIVDLMDNKRILPILIIDEAQNLPHQFWCDFPSFLNFAFDSRDMMTVWLLGHPELDFTLARAPYAALQSRIQVRHKLKPIDDKTAFASMIKHGFEEAGCQKTLLSDSGVELIRVASQGKLRLAHLLIVASLRIAADKGMNHLSDDIIREGIEILQG